MQKKGVDSVKKPLILFLMVIIFPLIFSFNVNADAGPKPSIEMIVKNPPQTEYYLDLLIDYNVEKPYKNIREDEINSKQMYNLLKNYNTDGWRPALVTGTRVPLHGELVGTKSGDNMSHYFSYVGVPDRFKVIIVTEDNNIIVSDNIIDRKAFNCRVYFDLDTNKLSESPLVLEYFIQFITTFIATFIIEGFILILFRFNLKQNWKTFLVINVITLAFLNFLIFGTMYYLGSFAAVFFYILFEIVIFITEAKLFAKYLKQHSKLRRVMFALTANIASFIFGFMSMLNYSLI